MSYQEAAKRIDEEHARRVAEINANHADTRRKLAEMRRLMGE